MVIHGHDTTLPITLEEMLVHCRSVARGAKNTFLVGDIPFGSYESSDENLLKSAIRILKEGGMHAVKLEGSGYCRVSAVRKLESGRKSCCHGSYRFNSSIYKSLGGFRPQANRGEGRSKAC